MPSMEDVELEGLEEPQHRRKKPWRADFNLKEIVVALEDDPMLQLFTNQDEIVEMLAQRQIFCCDPRQRLKLLKSLKKS